MSLDDDILDAFRQFLGGPCRAAKSQPFFALVFERGNLTIQSAWRLSQEQRLIGGSGQPKQIPALIEVFVGQSVTLLAVKGPYNDLVVSFSEGYTVETFADAANWEHWQIEGDNQELLIAGPGELWSSFPADHTARSKGTI